MSILCLGLVFYSIQYFIKNFRWNFRCLITLINHKKIYRCIPTMQTPDPSNMSVAGGFSTCWARFLGLFRCTAIRPGDKAQEETSTWIWMHLGGFSTHWARFWGLFRWTATRPGDNAQEEASSRIWVYLGGFSTCWAYEISYEIIMEISYRFHMRSVPVLIWDLIRDPYTNFRHYIACAISYKISSAIFY